MEARKFGHKQKERLPAVLRILDLCSTTITPLTFVSASCASQAKPTIKSFGAAGIRRLPSREKSDQYSATYGSAQ
jgi:hypothetical protein